MTAQHVYVWMKLLKDHNANIIQTNDTIWSEDKALFGSIIGDIHSFLYDNCDDINS